MPKPAVYGVYAIYDGQLIELNPVATAPVDPDQDRSSNYPAWRDTSRNWLLKFVVYRRDLIVGAPESLNSRCGNIGAGHEV
jgi:hypothetical protein